MSITRYQLDLVLRTDSPLHSGGAEHDVDRSAAARSQEQRETAPRQFARDAVGDRVLSGRSVKGALRAAWMEAYGHELARQDRDHPLLALWGDQDRAAALTVHAIDLSGVEATYRTGIAVDRYWGSAGDTALFEHEIIPAGVTLNLRLTAQVGSIQDDGDPTAVETLLGQVVGLLAAGRVSLGGRQNAGWGRVTLNEAPGPQIPVRRDALADPRGLLAFLANHQQQHSIPVQEVRPARGLTVVIGWRSPTGILIAEPRDEEEVNGGNGEEPVPTRPLRQRSMKGRASDEAGALVLPGSSVRGALRSRASRIARTILLTGEQADRQDRDWSGTGVHQQLAEDPRLVRELFGSTERRGAVRVMETPDSQRRAETLTQRTHNAGDRWTGGVKDGGLYCELIPDVDWNDLVLEVDLQRVARSAVNSAEALNRQRAALCLLGLVIAELATGTLTLGSRGTRGLGAVEVTAVSIDGDDALLDGAWRITADTPGAEGSRRIAEELLTRLRGLNEAIAADGGGAWTDYLDDAPGRTTTQTAQEGAAR
ncbi:RAMP superfamily CRISPR-associated protein [Actinomyces slackii]|uniref:CRISPR-associated RAMP protein, SSO1426 family n=1 Tax=Actinomyces slackii TaxID=52774 RepID=A0A448KBR9_9ACTO|nr:RAMP superfamily CRISPR-associated protein [Actinomyces slackii]VEG74357.1 CRISPR-associated RAMP protein, SSO1426 family [Actinomyces slackii]